MRKPKSVAEFSDQRNQFLLKNFREAIAVQSKIDLSNAFKTSTRIPAPRFWVSEQRAAGVVGKMLAGHDPTADMYEEKREMYREIFRRFMKLREERPEESIYQLVFEVVNNPAPRSYISEERARKLIYVERRTIKERRPR